MKTIDYSDQLNRHLGIYKSGRLSVREDGLSRSGFKHPYILPETYQRLNILETYRAEFWSHFDARVEERNPIFLQPGFHQLNATQAMGFNLFIPFLHDAQVRDLLLNALRREPDTMKELLFDRIIDRDEVLRMDFFVSLESEAQLLFELKLTEPCFDLVLKPTPGQMKRLETIYAPLLKGKVPDIYLRPETFFRFDHVLRNIALLEPERGDHLYVIIPRANEALCRQQPDIEAMCAVHLTDHVSVLYLEDLVDALRQQENDTTCRFRAHYELFAEKYLI